MSLANRGFTLNYSSVRQKKTNTSYPFSANVTCKEDLAKIATFDHVGAEFTDGKNNRGRMIQGYRSKKTFKRATVVIMDCDNTQPDPLKPDIPPEEWVTPDDVRKAFPVVAFYVVYSRNHMKEKDGLPARPKFHVYLFLNEWTAEKGLSKLKAKIREYFPAFDPKAVDTAHFIFGVENPTVEYYDGDITVDEFMVKLNKLPDVIPVGQRNGTLSQYAARVIKRHGDSEQARQAFDEAAAKCEEPLDDAELDTIWRSAQGFFHNTVEKDPGYKTAEEFTAAEFMDDEGEKKPVTSEDVKAILQKLNIRVRLNDISGMVEIEGMPPQYSKTNAPNVLPVILSDYMKEHNLKSTRQNIDDCLVLIMDENRFNPVKDMLEATVYDGRDHIKELEQILGIEGSERECTYLTKWLHQSVAMPLNDENEPYGADGVLVLQDEQGAGKTLFFATIAIKSDFFAEGVSIDLNNKDTVIQSTGVWIAELGELDSTLKREQSALKAFLTASRDTYRMPYARAQIRRPRRTSFCATVNPREFLNDETGSRRFWVIHPQHIDVDRIKELSVEWLKQLWRQVYEQLYLPNPQGFRLTKEEREMLQAHNEQYEKPLPGEIEITDKLNFEAPDRMWKWCKVSELLNGIGVRGITAVQAGKVLAKLAKTDSRIECKNVHNVKQYRLPPTCPTEFYHSTEDYTPPLTG
jgi:hypothetical protein